MNNARDQLWTYLNTHNNDELQRTDIIVMLKQIEKDHAAAVAAETERCAKVAEDHKGDYSHTDAAVGYDIACREIAAAIRARNSMKGE